MSDIDRAVEIIRHSQDTHRQWIEWIDFHEEHPGQCNCSFDEIIATAGDREHQVKCVNRYEFVITVLESMKCVTPSSK